MIKVAVNLQGLILKRKQNVQSISKQKVLFSI